MLLLYGYLDFLETSQKILQIRIVWLA